jgi:hypothetical protein
MYLTTHTSVALVIATKMTNPLLGFVFGIVSHFVLDFIPHGEDVHLGDDHKTHKQQIWKMFKCGMIDIIIATIFLSIFLKIYQPINHWIFLATVFGAWLPDLAWGSVEFFKLKALYWIVILHHRVHDFLDIVYSVKYGLPFQALIILAMMLFIF